ncbi:hypothetical protein BJS_03244 [Bradyrhizobium japonicum SEMIA 5079]|nr:hypothetical protein BJS_03244 [Bradyrhizobium japonicum SEMIA 5079]
MERSAIRGSCNGATLVPDFASLHPGDGSENLASAYQPTPAHRLPNTGGFVFTADQPKKWCLPDQLCTTLLQMLHLKLPVWASLCSSRVAV